jgi:hypothetical protein
MESMVTGKVSTVTTKRDAELIDHSATIVANVQISHRQDASRARTLAMSLLAELEAETGNIELFEQLGEMLRSDDEKGQDRRNDLYNKVISSAGRIDGMKKLSDTLKTLIGLEREAYGLADETPPPVAPSVVVNNAPPATLAEIQQVLRESAAAPKV